MNLCFSLPQIVLWPKHEPIDGYICESITGHPGTPSAILSKYFEKPVHLVLKGPNPRLADPTTSFPDLKTTVKIQDMYPLLVLSEESTDIVDAEVRSRVGTQEIDERWRYENVVIERYGLRVCVINYVYLIPACTTQIQAEYRFQRCRSVCRGSVGGNLYRFRRRSVYYIGVEMHAVSGEHLESV